MKNQTARTASAILLLAAITLYRLCIGLQNGHLPWLDNFAPVAAIALCGGIYLPRRLAFIVPLGALFISDIFLNRHYHAPLLSVEMISRYGALAVSVAIGFRLRGRAGWAAILPASVLGSCIFYFVTNTTAWLGSPVYAQTYSGWVQALTAGAPGYEPTWTFFRSSLISDLLFTILFVFCMGAAPAREPAPARARAV
jgi:hypothetical protein